MDTMSDVDLTVLRTVTRNLTMSAASIEVNQRGLSTPCNNWDLAALVDHIAGGNWFTAAVLAGARAENAMSATMERFGTGSASNETAIESLEVQATAFLRPRVLERTWNHVAGELSGRAILRLRLHDLIVHSWDVEETLRPGYALPDDLVRWGLDELAHDDSLSAQHFDLDITSVGRSASERSARYLDLFGR